MIEKPKVGMQCWIIADIWELLCPIPVTIFAEDGAGGVFAGRWELGDGFSEDYEGLWPEELYATEREAVEAIRAKRRIEHA